MDKRIIAVALVAAGVTALAYVWWRAKREVAAEPAVAQREIAPAPLPAGAALTPNGLPRTDTATYVLVATFAGMSPTAGRAIIETGADSARLYAAGAALGSATFLREVYADRAIINRDGHDEVLRLQHSSAARNSSAMTSPSEVSVPEGAQSDSLRLGATTYQNGIHGFPVYPGRNRGEFARLGLHPGDVLTAVNGVPIVGQSGDDLMSLVKGGSAVSLTVVRAGREQEIQLR